MSGAHLFLFFIACATLFGDPTPTPSPVDEGKALKFFFECVALTDDEVQCFDETKVQLVDYIFNSIENAEPTCDSIKQHKDNIQQALAEQQARIKKASTQANNQRQIGLSSCLNDLVKKLKKLDETIVKRVKQLKTETTPAACKETYAFFSVIGLHGKVIGQLARNCYTSKMPDSLKSKASP